MTDPPYALFSRLNAIKFYKLFLVFWPPVFVEVCVLIYLSELLQLSWGIRSLL